MASSPDDDRSDSPTPNEERSPQARPVRGDRRDANQNTSGGGAQQQQQPQPRRRTSDFAPGEDGECH